jgi:acyl transferase domain-containing protein
MEDYQSYLKTQKSTGQALLTNGVQNSTEPRSRLFALSGKDEAAVKNVAEKLKVHLEQQTPSIVDEEKYLDDLAYTLGQRRTKLPWVTAHAAKSVSELVDSLTKKVAPTKTTDPKKVGFVFTGQGAQWWAMGRELIEAYPLFKASVLEAEAYLHELGSTWNLIGK